MMINVIQSLVIMTQKTHHTISINSETDAIVPPVYVYDSWKCYDQEEQKAHMFFIVSGTMTLQSAILKTMFSSCVLKIDPYYDLLVIYPNTCVCIYNNIYLFGFVCV